MKYCSLCKRYVDPVKSKFNWAIFLLLCFTIAGGLIYLIYHLFFKRKNRCPLCYTKKLVKYSPEDAEARKLEKQEKKEARIEAVGNAVAAAKDGMNKISEKVTGEDKVEKL